MINKQKHKSHRWETSNPSRLVPSMCRKSLTKTGSSHWSIHSKQRCRSHNSNHTQAHCRLASHLGYCNNENSTTWIRKHSKIDIHTYKSCGCILKISISRSYTSNTVYNGECLGKSLIGMGHNLLCVTRTNIEGNILYCKLNILDSISRYFIFMAYSSLRVLSILSLDTVSNSGFLKFMSIA